MEEMLDDGVRRTGSWTEEEDALLCSLVAELGTKSWSVVAERMGGARSGKSCRLRWHNQLDPSVNKTPFTEWEQAVIFKAQTSDSYANRWAAIARMLQARTDNSVKNHWHATLARRARAGTLVNRYLEEGVSLDWLLANPELRDPTEIAASANSKRVMGSIRSTGSGRSKRPRGSRSGSRARVSSSSSGSTGSAAAATDAEAAAVAAAALRAADALQADATAAGEAAADPWADDGAADVAGAFGEGDAAACAWELTTGGAAAAAARPLAGPYGIPVFGAAGGAGLAHAHVHSAALERSLSPPAHGHCTPHLAGTWSCSLDSTTTSVDAGAASPGSCGYSLPHAMSAPLPTAASVSQPGLPLDAAGAAPLPLLTQQSLASSCSASPLAAPAAAAALPAVAAAQGSAAEAAAAAASLAEQEEILRRRVMTDAALRARLHERLLLLQRRQAREQQLRELVAEQADQVRRHQQIIEQQQHLSELQLQMQLHKQAQEQLALQQRQLALLDQLHEQRVEREQLRALLPAGPASSKAVAWAAGTEPTDAACGAAWGPAAHAAAIADMLGCAPLEGEGALPDGADDDALLGAGDLDLDALTFDLLL